ncbi:MAG TPA: hypothetical protein VGC30_09565 [Dokdonella sp.]
MDRDGRNVSTSAEPALSGAGVRRGRCRRLVETGRSRPVAAKRVPVRELARGSGRVRSRAIAKARPALRVSKTAEHREPARRVRERSAQACERRRSGWTADDSTSGPRAGAPSSRACDPAAPVIGAGAIEFRDGSATHVGERGAIRR